ncbi:MAG: AAA family ATPase, partial [Mycobacterium sp.]
SMDIAAAVGPERLREIMGDLVKRSAVVVKRYGGTVDKFTGDGIMALFGAPVALEDHAFRACLAALDIQHEARRLAAEVQSSDRVELQLRVGLNSGQVIAGDIGSAAMGYTAIGEHVGMAQRMESVAPPGGVMLSESTARLVENLAALSEPEAVSIKGSDAKVPARRLMSTMTERDSVDRNAPTLVGRTWEMNSLAGILDEAVSGAGCVVNVVGPPGIGKSRLTQEAAALAADRGMDVITTHCESHATDIPFHAVARLLRGGFGIKDLDNHAARTRVRALVPDADPEDVLLLDDLLGIADPQSVPPTVEPDARRRRLTGLINTAILARTTPALFVIEDVHWIDEVSESMIAGFLAVVPQSISAVLMTFRPEYHGVLSRAAGAQTVALRPLNRAHAIALTRELLGSDPSVAALADLIAERAAGNPFFVEEMIRDLAERCVLEGLSGQYRLSGDAAAVSVPPTLQATIAARIDRLAPAAKTTLSAAAVIGSRFSPELLVELGIDPALDDLTASELIDQVKFTRGGEYVFRHPLIRTVAYESQLKSTLAKLHRQLANLIEARGPDTADENAASIAEHLEAAGDLHAAFAWHMRAGTWSTNRSITAAHTSWRKAVEVADRLAFDDPDRLTMRIAPRTLLCGSAWRAGGSGADLRFDELRELCEAAGDKRSLAVGMAGAVVVDFTKAQRRAASNLASELMGLLESINDPTLTLALTFMALTAKLETAEVTDVLLWARAAIDAAEGDPTRGDLIVGSPLAATMAMRSIAKWCLGVDDWRDDFQRALEVSNHMDAVSQSGTAYFTYGVAIPVGVWRPDATTLSETAEVLAFTERSGDDLGLNMARTAHGVAVLHADEPDFQRGIELLTQVRDEVLHDRYSYAALPIIDAEIARAEAASGQVDAGIQRARAVVDDLLSSDGWTNSALAVAALVEALVRRGADEDLAEAQVAVDRLAAVPTEPGFVLNEITVLRLRALLARARGENSYGALAERYREMAESLGFEGHITMAEAML